MKKPKVKKEDDKAKDGDKADPKPTPNYDKWMKQKGKC